VRTRAHRRHYREKELHRWHVIGTQWGVTDDNVRYREGLHGWVVRTAGNMPTCSNPMCCGNPRKLGRKTWQEKRAEINEIEQREEL
jgi:hypothetical protein